MIPESMLPHDVTIVRPTWSADDFGNSVPSYELGDATRTVVRGWVQQDTRQRITVDGGLPLESVWTVIVNTDDVLRRDRIEWSGYVFVLDGHPNPVSTPSGFHHTELRCQAVDG